MYIDPRTGEHQEIGDMVHPTMHSACLGAIVLLIGVLLAGAYTYWTDGSLPTTNDNGVSATTP